MNTKKKERKKVCGSVKLKDSKCTNIRAGLSKCPLFRQLTMKVLRTDQRGYQGPEVYM